MVMEKEQILKELERDSFNGDLTISEFRKRVEMYAEKYHEEKLKENMVEEMNELLEAIAYKKFKENEESKT